MRKSAENDAEEPLMAIVEIEIETNMRELDGVGVQVNVASY